MPEIRPSNDAPLLDLAARCHSVRDKMLVGLLLLTLVRTGEALAGDQTLIANASLNADADSLRRSSPHARALISVPEVFAVPTADGPVFSTTDFRPRKRTIFDSDPMAKAVNMPVVDGLK